MTPRQSANHGDRRDALRHHLRRTALRDREKDEQQRHCYEGCAARRRRKERWSETGTHQRQHGEHECGAALRPIGHRHIEKAGRAEDELATLRNVIAHRNAVGP